MHLITLLFIAILLITSPAYATEVGVLDKLGDEENKANLHPYMDDNTITIATGNASGFYYRTGEDICRLINRDSKQLNLHCNVKESNGSVNNLNMLSNNEVDFVLAQSDIQENAYNGEASFNQNKLSKLRFVLSLYHEALAVIVKKDSNIESLNDLVGKAIDIGAKGSGVEATWQKLMQAKRWDTNVFKRVGNFNLLQNPQSFCLGQVEAVVSLAAHPNPLIDKISQNCEIKMIQIDDQDVNTLINANPEFVSYIIPGGTYAGVPNGVQTLATKATLLSSTDVSHNIVYKLTKYLFENLSTLKSINPIIEDLQTKQMINDGRTAPYHPGAFRYYDEHNALGDKPIIKRDSMNNQE